MKRIKTLTLILFREIARDKVFISLAAGSVLVIIASLLLNEMIVGDKLKATKDFGVSVLNIFPFLVLLFIGINLVSDDINGKRLQFILSKSVKRNEYVISSGFAIYTSIIFTFLFIGGTLACIFFLSGDLWIKGILLSLFFTAMEMLVLLSFTVFLPMIASAQLSMFLLTMIYIIGHSIQNALVILENSSNIVLNKIFMVFSFILPNFDLINHKREILYNLPITFGTFISVALYSISYAAILFYFAIIIFSRRDI
jgi:ABC-type transport system involved in multi-copper enzyme maturation permease subunit